MEKQSFKIGLLYLSAHGQNHCTAESCLFPHHVCSKLNCSQMPGRTPVSRSKTRVSGWRELGERRSKEGGRTPGERRLNLPSSTGRGGQNGISKSKRIWTEQVNSRDSWRPMKIYGINERTLQFTHRPESWQWGATEGFLSRWRRTMWFPVTIQRKSAVCVPGLTNPTIHVPATKQQAGMW